MMTLSYYKLGTTLSLETQNELWVSDDAAWNYLPNALYRIRISYLLCMVNKSRNIEKIMFKACQHYLRNTHSLFEKYIFRHL